MRAVISKQVSNGRNFGDKKETVSRKQLMAMVPGRGIVSIVDARCYMGRSRNASVVYASVWIHSPSGEGRPEVYTAGHGNAGGYGYHKESAAIAAALDSAGVELFGSPYEGRDGDETRRADIGGCGDSSVDAALIAIGDALGYSDMVIA